ncbi:MAG: hypothetical protein ACOX8W_11485 [bacterium]
MAADSELLANGKTVNFRQYRLRLRQVISHLKAKHGLTEEGGYLSLWIAIGLCFGGVFNNILGPAYIGLGLCLGIAVGTALDADAKKKGRQI